jgi:hypothetical protein
MRRSVCLIPLPDSGSAYFRAAKVPALLGAEKLSLQNLVIVFENL